ncbi:hypothetical protein HUU42_13220 [bacterium]|nr:hypothetical protein [bacterium]
MNRFTIITLLALCPLWTSTTTAQDKPKDEWEKHEFKNYFVEFKTPSDWYVTFNTDSKEEYSYIECVSPDNQMYFFITSTSNELKSSNDIILSYLKVTYSTSQFLLEEQKKINNIDFVFSTGITHLENIQTFIKLGVGNHKERVYLVDSGFNNVENKEAEKILQTIIESIRAID